MNRHLHRILFRAAAVLTLAIVPVLTASTAVMAANPNYTIGDNVPGFVKHATDLGAVDPSTQIGITVWLNLHNQNQLDQLVQKQYQHGSGSYHQWLTQDQFNANYAPTSQEVNSLENFLSAHNLTVTSVGDNNLSMDVTGTVGAVEKAFHVQIDNFSYGGATFRSNTGNPSVNDASGAHVAAITGMDNVGYQPTLVQATEPDGTPVQPVPLSSSPNGTFFSAQCFRSTQTVNLSGSNGTATYSGNRYGADITNNTLGALPPCGYNASELQTAYNMNPLYTSGLRLTGAGQTIVIVDAYGSPTIQTDANVYSQINRLPALTSSNFHVYSPPGVYNAMANSSACNRAICRDPGWAGETTLDVELAHAMAPGANIALVVAPTNGSALYEAINWAVVHHLGNVISNSWSTLEGFGNPAGFDRVNRILEQAAAEGIDVNFSSGDYGDETVAVGFKTVDFPASSPFATGIGGTSLFLNPDDTMAFQTGWGNNLTRLSYATASGLGPYASPLHTGFYAGAGGGPSLTYARPAWQTGAGLPSGTMRMVPDVSMVADPYTGAEIIETVSGQLSVRVIGGTSLACPMFSGIMAIASQKAGQGLGQVAPLLYSLSAGAVTDVTTPGSALANGNVTGSVTPAGGKLTDFTADQLAAPLDGVAQYLSMLYNGTSTRWYVITFGTDTSLSAGAGWDDVTGVGTPNGAAFVNALAP